MLSEMACPVAEPMGMEVRGDHLWITDMNNFSGMNEVWNAWVDPDNPPVRACVRADLARPELLVEIMVTATL